MEASAVDEEVILVTMTQMKPGILTKRKDKRKVGLLVEKGGDFLLILMLTNRP